MKSQRIPSIKKYLRFLLSAVLILLISMGNLLPATFAYADSKDKAAKAGETEEAEEGMLTSIREAHRVKVDDKKYCFFVQYNVILTPADIKKASSDEKLVNNILKESGFYMKEANCKQPSHEIITPKAWTKAGGSFLLSDEDIEALRQAKPSNGSPIKMSMDLLVSNEPIKRIKKPVESDKTEDKNSNDETISDEKSEESSAEDAQGNDENSEAGEDTAVQDKKSDDKEAAEQKQSSQPEEEDVEVISVPTYSTYKLLSPPLLFVVVATKSDAASGEDICKDIKEEDSDVGDEDVPDASEPEEMLPELRTISMPDRSGPPIESTLKDGDEVKLEWVDPIKKIKSDSPSTSDKIPAGALGAAVAVAVLAAAASVLIAKRKRQ